jgi:hypothetical protein
MILASQPATAVPIQGTFDIAIARNTLRSKIVQQRWPIVFNARAATALTALGELILALDRSQTIVIQIETLTDEKKCGIQLSSQFRTPEKKPVQWEERKRSVKSAALDSEIDDSGSEVRIRIRIWVE